MSTHKRVAAGPFHTLEVGWISLLNECWVVENKASTRKTGGIIPARESMANLIMSFDKGGELVFPHRRCSPLFPRKNTLVQPTEANLAPCRVR